MRIEKLHQVALAVRDLDESVRFYRDVLGARFLARFDPPGLAFFDLSGVRILLEHGTRPATVYLWVEDLDAAHEELTAMDVTFDSAPHPIHRDDAGTFGPAGTTEWMAFFRDPGDNIVALVTRR